MYSLFGAIGLYHALDVPCLDSYDGLAHLETEGYLRKRAVFTADRYEDIRGAGDNDIPPFPEPRYNRDLNVGVGMISVVLGQYPDRYPTLLLRATRSRLHDSAEPPAYHDRFPPRDESPHILSDLQGRLTCLRSTDDRDYSLAHASTVARKEIPVNDCGPS